MEKQHSDSRPAAAASCPPWVMLRSIGCKQYSIVAEAQAAAAACTSTNLLFHVSLLLAAPPASSMLCYGWSDSTSCRDVGRGKKVDELRVIAVHGDDLLLKVRTSSSQKSRAHAVGTSELDYFLYETGTGTARPPSLLMLPRCYFPWSHTKHHMPEPDRRIMNSSETGLLRYGEDEILVAQLELPFQYDDEQPRAELCVLRIGQEWELKQAVPILFNVHKDSKADVVMRRWLTDAVLAVGDRYLCWVDYLQGVLLGDMVADNGSLKLWYVALPMLPPERVSYFDDRPYMRISRDMGDAGAGTVRLVHVEPRCCCGGHGRSTCTRGRFLFTVTTWTLSLSMDGPLEWVKDGVLDCDDLWALPAYVGLPEVTVEYPIVSLDNVDVIWFMVRERDYANLSDRRVWMVEVDTRSKALLSVLPYNEASLLDSHVTMKLWC